MWNKQVVPKTDEELEAMATRETKYLAIILVALTIFQIIYQRHKEGTVRTTPIQRDSVQVKPSARPYSNHSTVRYTSNTVTNALSDSAFDATRVITIRNYQILSLLVKTLEDYKAVEYRCAAGHLTIGNGITPEELIDLNKTKKYSPPIRWKDLKHNRALNDLVLRDIFDLRLKYLREHEPYLDAPAAFACVSFSFNTGKNIYDSPSIRAGLNEFRDSKGKDRTSLANAMRKFVYARVKGKLTYLQGLANRREMEIKLLMKDFSEKDLDDLKVIVAKQYKK